ncbi:DMT family transporter [Labrenzia sp. CE80]|uniref:DMT family transporter n=1 Tax=Labrenzia sp. CE80 TaxID=1788986 RepID=UPI00129BBDD4|nr:DMT family transporter [Labrenzia sp. CE80]
MELWIPITIFAAFCQNLRSALQRHLKDSFGTTAATFVRFGYGFPFAVLYVGILHVFFGMPLPRINSEFLMSGALGGLAQIGATFLLIHLFSYRNFAVGTAYSKTEPIQAAMFGFVLLGETLSLPVMMCIVLGIIGVLMISLARTQLSAQTIARTLIGKSALIGLASAALFGASAAFYRSASLSLGGPGFLMQAGFSLACVTLFQSALMASWMFFRTPHQLSLTLRHWRISTLVGLAGILGSLGWFTAMTLQPVAYVRALAQIELVFTFAVSWLVFREAISRNELLGCSLIMLAVIGIVLSP